MTITDVEWTPHVNVLTIRCDCGTTWKGWTSHSAHQCPRCGRQELWHGVYPRVTWPWNLPRMKSTLRT